MVKILVLVLLLTVPAFQQLEVIAFSGDDTDITGEELNAELLITYNPAPSTKIDIDQPQDWKFLEKIPDPSHHQSKWIHPNGRFFLYPRKRSYCWTITFNSDCPQNGVTLSVGGTGHAFVQANPTSGPWPLLWGAPLQTHNVYIPSKDLNCGCNKARICVYNFWWSSPLAMWYGVIQNTTGCYKCPSHKYYDYQNCLCECKRNKNCCPNPLIQDRETCGCVRPWSQSGGLGIVGIRP